jgi:hypothetical protein
MNKLKEFFTSKLFETFLWQTLNAFIALIVVVLGDVSWVYAPLIISVLNPITKYINLKFIK